MRLTKTQIKDLTYQINGAAIEVHKTLGPGLLESVYHKCLIQELKLRDIDFKSELNVPTHYKGINVESDLRCDLFIDGLIVVELKSVEKTLPVHEAQLLTYLKLLDFTQGMLISFNCSNIFNEGQKTYGNELYRLLKN